MRNSALLILLTVCGPATLAAQTPDLTQVLKQRVTAFQSAWNAHDAAAVTAFFTTDGDLIMEDGPTVQGKAALQQWWHDRFAEVTTTTAITLTVRAVRPIAPDVVLLNALAKVSGDPPQGRTMGSNEDRGTWVLVRQGGQWFISALRVQQVERPAGR